MSKGILELIAGSDPVAKLVLLILFVFSVVSWAVVGVKWLDFRRARKASAAFLHAFHTGATGKELYRLGRACRVSPLCCLFCEVYDRVGGGRRTWYSDGTDLWQLMQFQLAGAGETLGQHLGILATVGSVSPFIGLFGTVWGIMDAFRNIGFQGSANLAVVAPGIAEALIATVAGLAAAIPAVMAYNYFMRKISVLMCFAEQFAPDLAVWLKRRSQDDVTLSKTTRTSDYGRD